MKDAKIEQLLNKYATPLYVFDTGVLKKRASLLRSMLPAGISLCYAIKANTFILNDICDVVERLEVCSPGELSICRQLSIPPEKLVISGVYKTPDITADHIASPSSEACIYTVESMSQFELLKCGAHLCKKRLRLLLRLTSGNQFGLDERDIRYIVENFAADPFLDLCGIQYFSGTQKNSLKKLKREIDYVDAFLQSLYDEFGHRMREFEFGPGLPVSYFQVENFDERAFFAEFSSMLEGMKFKAGITLEIGRSLAAECGSYITRVVDTKENRGQLYAIVDGGINHIVYYGQSMAMRHPPHRIYPERKSDRTQNWNIFGSLCTVNDVLAKQLPAADLHAGDCIVFQLAGAYCMTEGISLFLSRELPGIVLVDENGRTKLARPSLTTYEFNTPYYRQEDK